MYRNMHVSSFYVRYSFILARDNTILHRIAVRKQLWIRFKREVLSGLVYPRYDMLLMQSICNRLYRSISKLWSGEETGREGKRKLWQNLICHAFFISFSWKKNTHINQPLLYHRFQYHRTAYKHSSVKERENLPGLMYHCKYMDWMPKLFFAGATSSIVQYLKNANSGLSSCSTKFNCNTVTIWTVAICKDNVVAESWWLVQDYSKCLNYLNTFGLGHHCSIWHALIAGL